MSEYSSLKAIINANVKTNGNQEITGSIMNSVLNAMVNSLGAGYQFIGVATPTNPGTAQTPDYKCFYLATTPGTYTHLGDLVVADGEVALLKWDAAWTKEVTGIASADKLNQLGQERNNSIVVVTQNNTTNGYFTVKTGKTIGGATDGISVACLDYLAVKPGFELLFNNPHGYSIAVYTYDEKFNYISADWFAERNSFVVPSDVAYIRCAFRLSTGLLSEDIYAFFFYETGINIAPQFVFAPDTRTQLEGAILDLSAYTLSFPYGAWVVFKGVFYSLYNITIELPMSGSTTKLFVFNKKTHNISFVLPNDVNEDHHVFGYIYFRSNTLGIYNYDLPFRLYYQNAEGKEGTTYNSIPVLHYDDYRGNAVNFDLSQNKIIFAPLSSIVIGRISISLSGSIIDIPTSGSSLKFLVFDYFDNVIKVVSSNLYISNNQYVLGWFVYSRKNVLSYNLPFPFTINGGEVESYKCIDWLQYGDLFKYQGHFFMEYIGGQSDPIIPSQTIFDVQFCKRVGVHSIEANVLATATPGKYIVMHGVSGKIGYQLMLKKSAYEANPSAYPNAVYDAGHDAYYNPDVVIEQTPFDELRENYFNRSIYPKYRVPITELVEFLQQCKTSDIYPIVTFVDNVEIDLVRAIMGDYYAIRVGLNSGVLNRHGGVMHIFWDNVLRTKDDIISLCKTIGKPFAYGMGVSVARQHTDDELKDIVDAVHKAGYFIVFDGNYYTEADNQRLFSLNFDGAATGWCVPDFNGNICDLSADVNYNDFTHTGSVAENLLTLQDGNTIQPNYSFTALSISKGLLKILFRGTINLTFGKASGEFTSDGSREMVFSTVFFNEIPTFTITSVGVTEIVNIKYSASKC